MSTPTPRFTLPYLCATFFGSGYSPVAPGTAGSAAGLILIVPLRRLGLPWLDLAAVAAIFAIGVWSATIVERESGKEDPGIVVLDEVLGMLISLLWLPLTWQVVLAAFLAFRIFDIIKPWPAGRLEYLGGGLGIMADDAMAGVYANLAVAGLVWWLPGLMR